MFVGRGVRGSVTAATPRGCLPRLRALRRRARDRLQTIAAIRLETASILCACRDDIQNSHPTGANSLAAPPLLPPRFGATVYAPLSASPEAHPERPALIERSGGVNVTFRYGNYLPNYKFSPNDEFLTLPSCLRKDVTASWLTCLSVFKNASMTSLSREGLSDSGTLLSVFKSDESIPSTMNSLVMLLGSRPVAKSANPIMRPMTSSRSLSISFPAELPAGSS